GGPADDRQEDMGRREDGGRGDPETEDLVHGGQVLTEPRREIGWPGQERDEQLLDIRPDCGREREAPAGGEADPEEQEERRDSTDEAGGPVDPSRAGPDDPAEEGDPDKVHAERGPEDPARVHGTEPPDHVHEDGEDEEQVRPEEQGGRDPQEALGASPNGRRAAVQRLEQRRPERSVRDRVLPVVHHAGPRPSYIEFVSRGRYHFDDRARKAIPRVAVALVGGIELVNPLLGILAVVLVT